MPLLVLIFSVLYFHWLRLSSSGKSQSSISYWFLVLLCSSNQSSSPHDKTSVLYSWLSKPASITITWPFEVESRHPPTIGIDASPTCLFIIFLEDLRQLAIVAGESHAPPPPQLWCLHTLKLSRYDSHYTTGRRLGGGCHFSCVATHNSIGVLIVMRC